MWGVDEVFVGVLDADAVRDGLWVEGREHGVAVEIAGAEEDGVDVGFDPAVGEEN